MPPQHYGAVIVWACLLACLPACLWTLLALVVPHARGDLPNQRQSVNPLLSSVAPSNPHERSLWKLSTEVSPEVRVDPPRDFPYRIRENAQGQRIAIITTANGQYASDRYPGYSAALSGRECYAIQHNYTSIVERAKPPEIRGLTDGPYWSKLYVVARYLRYFDWVAWMDADVIVKRTDVALEDFLEAGYDVVVSDAPDGSNNGIWFVRRSAWGYYFLQRWFNERTHIYFVSDNGPWMEALVHLVHEFHNKTYAGECVRRNADRQNRITNHGGYCACYDAILAGLGAPVGRRRHDRVKFNYARPHCGFNTGHGWQGRNRWRVGCFLLHFAGQPIADKQRNMVQEARPEWINGTCETQADVPRRRRRVRAGTTLDP